MSRTVQRCKHCRSEKGRPHKPFCRTVTLGITSPTDTATIWVTSIESSSGGSGTSSSDCGSGSSGE